MNANAFKGTGVALVTPFTQGGKIDFPALERLVNHVIGHGVNYLVALGTTAETPTLSHDEKLAVLLAVIAANNGRVPLVCGLGGNNTSEILHQMESYPLQQVDALLSVSPYYNKPTQTGIVAHYKELDRYSPKPIILYNVPGRTGSNMNADTTLQIATECSNVIAIKEASGNMSQCMELVLNKPGEFLVLSGDDNLALAQMAIGFDGVISVAANCFTADFCLMIQYALQSDFVKARPLHYKLLKGIDLLFSEGNPAGVKCVLEYLHICENELRLPLVPVSTHTRDLIGAYMQKVM